MKRQLFRTLVIASFATMACNAGAENSTPRELPNGSTPAMGTQNGTPAQTPPAAGYQSSPGAYPATGNSQSMRGRMTNDQMRDYMDARKSCASQPAPQMEMCNNDTAKCKMMMNAMHPHTNVMKSMKGMCDMKGMKM